MKKIYLISQDENDGYDTYDSAVVCAGSEDEARNINPDRNWGDKYSAWASTPDKVNVKYLGIADDRIEIGIIMSSFNAG